LKKLKDKIKERITVGNDKMTLLRDDAIKDEE